MNETKIIKLDNLSEKARGILVEAIPHQSNGISSTDTKYYDLYQDFQSETGGKYVGEDSFNYFQVAVLGMKRKLKTLTYKDNRDLDVMRKVML
jgi:hypothetical protein